MSTLCFDSRGVQGTDIDVRATRESSLPEETDLGSGWLEMRTIRVVVGRLGPMIRLSAAELDVVVDGESLDEAWAAFLGEARALPKTVGAMFDLGTLTEKEIAAALDAPEDESWADGGEGE